MKSHSEYDCPFELFKDSTRTRSTTKKYKNHTFLRNTESTYNFIELKSDFFEKGIDDLRQKTQIAAAGIEELRPSDLLLFTFLKQFGFRQAYDQVKYNKENNHE